MSGSLFHSVAISEVPLKNVPMSSCTPQCTLLVVDVTPTSFLNLPLTDI